MHIFEVPSFSMVRVILSVCFVFEDLELAEWTLPPRSFQVIRGRKNLKTTKSLSGDISSTVRPRMLQVKDPFDLLNLLFIKGLFTPDSKRKSSRLLRGLRKEALFLFLNLTSSRWKIKICGRSTIWWRKVQNVLVSQRPCKFWGRAETQTRTLWSYLVLSWGLLPEEELFGKLRPQLCVSDFLDLLLRPWPRKALLSTSSVFMHQLWGTSVLASGLHSAR